MPIQAISAALPPLPTLPVGAGGAAGPAGAAKPSGEFGTRLANHVDELQAKHDTTNALAQQAATGDLTDAHDYMIAATESSLATELTMAVRNRAVEAFTSIMQMPV